MTNQSEVKIENVYDMIGNQHKIIRMSYNKGIKHFGNMGFVLSANKMYMHNDASNTYVHYNSISKCWYLD